MMMLNDVEMFWVLEKVEEYLFNGKVKELQDCSRIFCARDVI